MMGRHDWPRHVGDYLLGISRPLFHPVMTGWAQPVPGALLINRLCP